MKKYENFARSLDNLKDIYLYDEPYENIVPSGMVSLFSICWKAMKEILEDAGFSSEKTGSQRQVLKLAYGAGMIENEHIWLDALSSGNNVAHSYNENIAIDIVRKTKESYFALFEDLRKEIESNWI